jgi:hypothetical protein
MLRRAVGAGEAEAHGVGALHEHRWDDRAAGDRVPDRARVERSRLHSSEQLVEMERRADERERLVPLDVRTDEVDVPAVDEDGRRARERRTEDREQPGDVPGRPRLHDDPVAPPGGGLGHAVQLGHERLVRVEHALRVGRRPRRVHDEQGIVGIEVDGVHGLARARPRWRREEVGPCDRAGADVVADHHDGAVLGPRHRVETGVEVDVGPAVGTQQNRRVRLLEDEPGLGRAVRVHDRHEHRAGGDRAQIRLERHRPVRELHGDDVALAHADRGERSRDRTSAPGKVADGHDPGMGVGRDHEPCVGILTRRAFDDVEQCLTAEGADLAPVRVQGGTRRRGVGIAEELVERSADQRMAPEILCSRISSYDRPSSSSTSSVCSPCSGAGPTCAGVSSNCTGLAGSTNCVPLSRVIVSR